MSLRAPFPMFPIEDVGQRSRRTSLRRLLQEYRREILERDSDRSGGPSASTGWSMLCSSSRRANLSLGCGSSWTRFGPAASDQLSLAHRHSPPPRPPRPSSNVTIHRGPHRDRGRELNLVVSASGEAGSLRRAGQRGSSLPSEWSLLRPAQWTRIE